MTIASISQFEQSIQTANEWLRELNDDLGRDDRQQAYRMMRAVLISLRDRLTVEEASDLGAQLPMLIRGIYYESFNPSNMPHRERTREAFLAHVAEHLQGSVDGDPEEVTRVVFKLIAHHVTPGQIDHLRACLPRDIESLWEGC